MTGKNETFVMNDYGKKSTFASFLPGIAGIRGIPIWCYYVNRGQCVVLSLIHISEPTRPY